eukprot:sb/3479017/
MRTCTIAHFNLVQSKSSRVILDLESFHIATDIRVPLSGGLSLKFDGLYLTVFIEDSRLKLTYDGAMSLTLTLQNPREFLTGDSEGFIHSVFPAVID